MSATKLYHSFHHYQWLIQLLGWYIWQPSSKRTCYGKFQELKMGTSSLSNFYSEFIWLASDLKYISEMLIWGFKHKLMPRLQNWLNSGIKLPTSILALAKLWLFINEQMQATNLIRDRTNTNNINFSIYYTSCDILSMASHQYPCQYVIFATFKFYFKNYDTNVTTFGWRASPLNEKRKMF